MEGLVHILMPHEVMIFWMMCWKIYRERSRREGQRYITRTLTQAERLWQSERCPLKGLKLAGLAGAAVAGSTVHVLKSFFLSLEGMNHRQIAVWLWWLTGERKGLSTVSFLDFAAVFVHLLQCRNSFHKIISNRSDLLCSGFLTQKKLWCHHTTILIDFM